MVDTWWLLNGGQSWFRSWCFLKVANDNQPCWWNIWDMTSVCPVRHSQQVSLEGIGPMQTGLRMWLYWSLSSCIHLCLLLSISSFLPITVKDRLQHQHSISVSSITSQGCQPLTLISLLGSIRPRCDQPARVLHVLVVIGFVVVILMTTLWLHRIIVVILLIALIFLWL